MACFSNKKKKINLGGLKQWQKKQKRKKEFTGRRHPDCNRFCNILFFDG
jgi:hypothetical protein